MAITFLKSLKFKYRIMNFSFRSCFPIKYRII